MLNVRYAYEKSTAKTVSYTSCMSEVEASIDSAIYRGRFSADIKINHWTTGEFVKIKNELINMGYLIERRSTKGIEFMYISWDLR